MSTRLFNYAVLYLRWANRTFYDFYYRICDDGYSYYPEDKRTLKLYLVSLHRFNTGSSIKMYIKAFSGTIASRIALRKMDKNWIVDFYKTISTETEECTQ